MSEFDFVGDTRPDYRRRDLGSGRRALPLVVAATAFLVLGGTCLGLAYLGTRPNPQQAEASAEAATLLRDICAQQRLSPDAASFAAALSRLEDAAPTTPAATISRRLRDLLKAGTPPANVADAGLVELNDR